MSPYPDLYRVAVFTLFLLPHFGKSTLKNRAKLPLWLTMRGFMGLPVLLPSQSIAIL
jgi:hypothetical protein